MDDSPPQADLVELVRVTTGDGLRLDGALSAALPDATARPVADAALLVHGTGSNFYSSSLLEAVAQRLHARGISALRVNTRGHDGMSTASSPSGGVPGGAAYEMVGDCLLDLAAWIDLLAARGFKRVMLVGHSLGALKCLHYLTHESDSRVGWLVAISPPRLSYQRFATGPRGELFLTQYRQAEQFVQQGRGDELMPIQFPIPYVITARGYLDKYGRDERYNLISHLPRLSLPALVTYGGQETQSNPAFQGLPDDIEQSAAANSLPLTLAVVAGADHFYSGCRSELLQRVDRWLKRQ